MNIKLLNIQMPIMALFVVLALGCQDQKKAGQVQPVSVKIMTISLQSNSQSKSYVGTAEESYGAELNFSVPGSVSNVYVSAGQSVKQGQLLADLDKATLKNSVDATKSSLNQAEDGYRRMKEMFDNGSLPEVKLVDIETKLAQARSAYQIAKTNLDNSELRAPFSGVISSKSIDAGNYVLPTSPAFKLVKIENVNIKISVPENEISKVKINQQAKFCVSALDNREFSGKISEKGIAANMLSHTYDVKISANNSDCKIMPGMVCSVSLIDDSAQKVIIVPDDVVKIDADNQTFVWVAQNGVAKKRQVSVGQSVVDGVIILQGLNEGDKVITDGSSKVSEDSKISE